MNIIIMFAIVFLLAFVILYKIKVSPTNTHFFNLYNSKAMRGFWCLIVILVHVPQYYGNNIQDMIGSFAYIGVSFFFLTSGYGLTISQDKDYNKIKYFWRNRLPKLLISNWLVRIFFAILWLILFNAKIDFFEIISIDLWICWLIVCYFVFWLMFIIFHGKRGYKTATCLLIVWGSYVMYVLKKYGIITSTIWSTECFGFIWGIALASNKDCFVNFFSNKWKLKWVISTIVAIVLGVLYLMFKYIPYVGDYLLKIALGLAILLFVLIANTKIEFGNRYNQFLGMLSLEIYIVHGFVFTTLEALMDWKYSGMFILTSIVLTIIVAWPIHLISDKLVRGNKLLNKHKNM